MSFKQVLLAITIFFAFPAIVAAQARSKFPVSASSIVPIDEPIDVVLIILTKIEEGGFCEKNYFLRIFPVRVYPSR